MSVQTQIDRLASAKAAIKTAIEGKGVTVPDATMLDGFASLIDGIEAGGGVSSIKIASGTIVLSEPLSLVEFTHNFGEDINFFALFTLESGVNSRVGLYSCLITRNRVFASRRSSSGSDIYIKTGVNSGHLSSDVTLIIGNYGVNRNYNVRADDTKLYIQGYCEDGMVLRLADGVQYMWLASTWSDN